MKQLDFYEFTGIMMPGLLLIAISLPILPPTYKNIISGDLTEAIYILALGYATGHLIQALGNIIEKLFWKIFSGQPTDWLRIKTQKQYNESWRLKIFSYFSLDVDSDIDQDEWRGYVRLMTEYVNGLGDKAKRLGVFNGNYGMFRGMATAFILVLVVYGSLDKLNIWGGIFLSILVVLSFLRMYRFGKYYAATLFAVFINNIGN